MSPKEIIVKTAVTGVVKVASALIVFFMTLIVTRNLSSEDSGFVFLSITILTVASIIFRLGFDNFVLRKISAEFRDSTARGVLLTGIIWISIFSVPFSILASYFSDSIAVVVFNKEGFSPAFKIAILGLPAISIFMLLSKAFQGVQRVTASVFFLNFGVSLLFSIIFILFLNVKDETANAMSSMIIYVISAYTVLFMGLILWNRICEGDWGKVFIFNQELLKAGSNLWVASVSTIAVQWSSVLIAGAFIDASDFAQLSAAQRTASLVSFILMIVNMVVAPRFAVFWKQERLSEMKSLAKWSSRGCVLISTPLVIIIMSMSSEIMALFGDSYSNGAFYLSVLALGQYVNVVTGSVGYLLTMSGHERDYRQVTFSVGVLTIGLSYFFIVQFGALGAAIAAAVGLSLQNISALFLVKKRLGFFPIG